MSLLFLATPVGLAIGRVRGKIDDEWNPQHKLGIYTKVIVGLFLSLSGEVLIAIGIWFIVGPTFAIIYGCIMLAIGTSHMVLWLYGRYLNKRALRSDREIENLRIQPNHTLKYFKSGSDDHNPP